MVLAQEGWRAGYVYYHRFDTGRSESHQTGQIRLTAPTSYKICNFRLTDLSMNPNDPYNQKALKISFTPQAVVIDYDLNHGISWIGPFTIDKKNTWLNGTID